jgi:hypothetical protein
MRAPYRFPWRRRVSPLGVPSIRTQASPTIRTIWHTGGTLPRPTRCQPGTYGRALAVRAGGHVVGSRVSVARAWPGA